jgi:3-phenylpropionate/cinnamic acid dioxygenase small subunit
MAREGDQLSVLSNFHLYYARPGSENAIYSGQRRDVLQANADSYRIRSREVIMDYAMIELPTLGLLL